MRLGRSTVYSSFGVCVVAVVLGTGFSFAGPGGVVCQRVQIRAHEGVFIFLSWERVLVVFPAPVGILVFLERVFVVFWPPPRRLLDIIPSTPCAP